MTRRKQELSHPPFGDQKGVTDDPRSERRSTDAGFTTVYEQWWAVP